MPLLDLQAQYAPFRDEILAAITRVCDSQRFILGPEVEALERELATARSRRADAIAVSSGTDALLAALMALGIGPGDEVITTDLLVLRHRRLHQPARRDAGVRRHRSGRRYNLDPGAVGAAITPRTRAIMPVHLFGQCADMDPCSAAAREAGRCR